MFIEDTDCTKASGHLPRRYNPYMVSKLSVAATTHPVYKACAHRFKYTVNVGAAATCNTVSSHNHYGFQPAVWLIF